MQKFALEKYRIFPYIAWILIAGFSLFVYSLILNLQAVVADLSATTADLEAAIDRIPHETATSTHSK